MEGYSVDVVFYFFVFGPPFCLTPEFADDGRDESGQLCWIITREAKGTM
jgi:hypothetical protein